MWNQAAEGQQEIERNSPKFVHLVYNRSKNKIRISCILASKLSYLIFMIGSDFHTCGAARRCFNW